MFIYRFYKISVIVALLLTLFSVFYMAYVKNISLDEFEHIQSTFNIYYGMLPYRDYFEHHHGLFWYLSAPILAPFFNQGIVLFVLRTIALVIFGTLLFVIYKICNILGVSRWYSLAAPILFANIREMQYSAIEFRPDVLMTIFFLFGVYYLLKYIDNKESKNIYISFFLFFLSFLVLQKVIIYCISIFFVVLFLLKTRRLTLGVLFKAIYFPFLLFLTYIAYLYHTDSLRDYWESCWVLNYMIKFSAFDHSIFYRIFLMLGMISTLYMYWSAKDIKNKFFAIIALIIILLIVTIFPPYAPQYYILPYCLFCISMGFCFKEFAVKKKDNSVFVACLLVLISISLVIYNKVIKRDLPLSVQATLIQHVINYSKPTDYIINNYYIGGVRPLAIGYYWFDFHTSPRVHHQLFPRREFPDLNKIIQTVKPKIITSESVILYDCVDDDFRKIPCEPEQVLDTKALDKDYTYNGFIYIRKW